MTHGSPDSPTRTRPDPTPRIDAGWIFMLSGLALLLAGALIPANASLGDALDRRDDTLALEAARLEELDRAETVLAALERGDERLLRSLGASQLGLLGEDRAALAPDLLADPSDVALLDSLTPAVHMPDRPARPVSRLERLTTAPTSRLWLIGGSAILIMLGLYPPGSGRPRPDRRAADPGSRGVGPTMPSRA